MKHLLFKKRVFSFILLSLIGIQLASSQTSESTDNQTWKGKPWPISHFSAHLGGFWALSTTKLGTSAEGRATDIIDFENDLGMNRNTASILFNFNARFGKRNRIDFSYYNIMRSSEKTLDRTITFKDTDYPIDTDIKAHLNTNIFRLSYGYAFISNSKWEAGALIGFHIMGFNTGIKATGGTTDASKNSNTNFTAPLPDVGLWGTFAFHRNWAVSAELSYFYVKVNIDKNDISGRILSGNLALQYRISHHWQVDLGYNAFGVKVDWERRVLHTDMNWNYTGPSLSVGYRFGH